MAAGGDAPPHGAGRGPTPHFLSRKENAPLTVEKKQGRFPAKALAGIPAPELRNGGWARRGTSVQGNDPGKALGV
jgi:hypothetical protein